MNGTREKPDPGQKTDGIQGVAVAAVAPVRRPARNRWLRAVAVLAWVPPLAFLGAGYWPFLLIPAVAISAWALTGANGDGAGSPTGTKRDP